MADFLVRGLSPASLEKLKERARRGGRSLQAEVRTIIENAAHTLSMEEAKKVAARIRKKLRGRRHTDSSLLLARDRNR